MGEKLMIQIIREEKGITQRELADKLKINRSLLSHFETGKALPGFNTLLEIARILGCLITDLYYKKDIENIKERR